MINALKNIFLSILVTLLFLCFLEGLALIFEKWKGYTYTPEQENLLNPEKEPNEIRIFVYGGSTVYGVHLPDAGFVRQLEFILKQQEAGKKVQVVNYGVPGLSSTMVLKKMNETISGNPDAIIVLTGHNEFLKTLSGTRLRMVLALKSYVNRFAGTRFLQQLVKKLSSSGKSTLVFGNNIETYSRESQLFKEKVQVYKDNIASIVTLVRSKKIPLILSTVPSNIKDWPPSVWNEKQKSWISGGVRIQELKELKQALEKNPRNPGLLFQLGQKHYEDGKYERAKQILIKAKDLDAVPWRVLSIFNHTVRSFSNLSGVYVADIERSFENASPNGLVGFSLISDNCHPTPEGNFVIAQELYKQLIQTGILQTKTEPLPTFFQLSEKTQHTSRTNQLSYFLENGRYTLKPPFLNLSVSKRYFQQALELAPENWEIWAYLGSIAFFEGDISKGKEHMKKITQLYPEGKRVVRNFHPYLYSAAEKAGIDPDLFFQKVGVSTR